MKYDKYAARLREIAYGIKAPREETPRQRTLRLYPHLMPTRAQVERAKRMALGSPGAKEWLDEILVWSKKNWKWLLGGGSLYAILLVVAARRGK